MVETGHLGPQQRRSDAPAGKCDPGRQRPQQFQQSHIRGRMALQKLRPANLAEILVQLAAVAGGGVPEPQGLRRGRLELIVDAMASGEKIRGVAVVPVIEQGAAALEGFPLDIKEHYCHRISLHLPLGETVDIEMTVRSLAGSQFQPGPRLQRGEEVGKGRNRHYQLVRGLFGGQINFQADKVAGQQRRPVGPSLVLRRSGKQIKGDHSVYPGPGNQVKCLSFPVEKAEFGSVRNLLCLQSQAHSMGPGGF